MGKGKPLCIFGKYFTKLFKVKHFIAFYREFYGQRKIFYKFNYIFPTNKHLKMEKYFTLKQIEHNRTTFASHTLILIDLKGHGMRRKKM